MKLQFRKKIMEKEQFFSEFRSFFDWFFIFLLKTADNRFLYILLIYNNNI